MEVKLLHLKQRRIQFFWKRRWEKAFILIRP